MPRSIAKMAKNVPCKCNVQIQTQKCRRGFVHRNQKPPFIHATTWTWHWSAQCTGVCVFGRGPPPPPSQYTHTHGQQVCGWEDEYSIDNIYIYIYIYIYIGTGFLLSKTVIVLLLLFAFRQQQDGIFLFIQDHLACQTGSDSCAVSSSQSLSVPFSLLTQTLQTRELRHKFWPSPTWRFFRCLSQFQLHS